MKIRINGAAPTPPQRRVLEELQARFGSRFPDGDYWYDRECGAFGLWNGPATGFLPARLEIAGPMPGHCSGGGTGVFVNGRELHPVDVAALGRVVGFVPPGHYCLDAFGNASTETGVPLGNLAQAVAGPRNWSRSTDYGCGRQHVGGDGSFFYFMDSNGNSAYVG